ncbi:unnamed protein product [Blepharisma stoltei]|uniref:Transmembrane protein n=1 Tax=Blepharisma stoltei TaxID=1481888 RepID=A0AAU9IZ37_9CILI|nr:unnamed protein product [Blepharisma stoltei]
MGLNFSYIFLNIFCQLNSKNIIFGIEEILFKISIAFLYLEFKIFLKKLTKSGLKLRFCQPQISQNIISIAFIKPFLLKKASFIFHK